MEKSKVTILPGPPMSSEMAEWWIAYCRERLEKKRDLLLQKLYGEIIAECEKHVKPKGAPETIQSPQPPKPITEKKKSRRSA